MAVSLHVNHFRFGIDELAESTHSWYANEDTNPAHTWTWGTFLLRFNEQETGGTAAGNTDGQFQYRKNGGAWTDITTTSANVKAVDPAAWANADDCTKRLSGTGTFENSGQGCTVDGLSGGAQNDIAASGCSETECGLQFIQTDLVNGDVIEFQLTSPDWTVTMDVFPSITIAGSQTYPKAFTEAASMSEGFVADPIFIFHQALTETWQAAEALVIDPIFIFYQTLTETWQAAENFVTTLILKISFSETWQAIEELARVFIPKSEGGGGFQKFFRRCRGRR